jgi:hypothetical protein
LRYKSYIYEPLGITPPISLVYLANSQEELQIEHLYWYATYMNGFEGAVTHLWASILSRARGDEVVIDGGMNTGWYTMLTAVMNFNVFAAEPQVSILYTN